MHVRRVEWGLWLALAITVVVSQPLAPVRAAPAPPRTYAGWAVEAYPEDSADEMEATVRRMVDNGANVVWIGHNNPGIVDPDKVEPGLSYAVYEAFIDSTDPRHGAAVAMIAAQHRLLAACRTVGVKAVLPVGYQIQMGRAWNENHPDDLRTDAAGQPLDIYGGGVSASFYAPSYRRDIEAYYRWVDAEFVQPYADVLFMLNLSDEPIGGDYSAHADAAFRAMHGFGFGDVGEDTDRQRLLGEFQSRYVVEYAIWSAELWAQIHPGLPVTMSFDGAQARQTFTMPGVEALFRDTPSNFVVTFDAYPRDGLPDVPLSDRNLVGLFLLARSAGLYSARYGKPLWLWAAANSWGLSQASSDPGTVSDAVANGIMLSLLVRQGGGNLQGIAYWNYNVREQGLYNDTHATAYDTETMFQRVSGVLPTLRRLMLSAPSRPEVLILSPPAWSHERIGAERASVLLEVQPYRQLAILAKEGVNAAVVSALDGWDLDGVRSIIPLSPSAAHLAAGDLDHLRQFLARGGKVVASPEVGAMLADVVQEPSELAYEGLIEQRGNLYVAQMGVMELFEDARHDTLSGFWREVLGLEEPQPGYRIATDDYIFHYHIGPEAVTVDWQLPFEAAGYRYGDQTQRAGWLHSTILTAVLGRREYLFLQRIWPFLPLV